MFMGANQYALMSGCTHACMHAFMHPIMYLFMRAWLDAGRAYCMHGYACMRLSVCGCMHKWESVSLNCCMSVCMYVYGSVCEYVDGVVGVPGAV